MTISSHGSFKNLVESRRDPNSSDIGYPLDTVWINIDSDTLFFCVDNGIPAVWTVGISATGTGTGSSSETASRTIYVRTTGNDSTGDGTTGSPFLTLERAVLDIKNYLDTYTININLGDGVYTLAEGLDFFRIYGKSSSTIRIQSESVSTIETNTATSNNTYSITRTGAGWTPEEHIGRLVDYGGSTDAPIVGNTSDTLYVSNIGTTVVSSYTIKENGATIQGAGLNDQLVGNWPAEAVNFNVVNINLTNLEIAPPERKSCVIDFSKILFNTNNYGVLMKGLLQTMSNSSIIISGDPILSTIEVNSPTSCGISLQNHTRATSIRFPTDVYGTFYNSGTKRNLFFSGGDERYINSSNYKMFGSTFINFDIVFDDIASCDTISHTFPQYISFGDQFKNRIVDCNFLGKVTAGMTYRNSDGWLGTPNTGWFTEDGITNILNYHTDEYTVYEFAPSTSERVYEDTLSISGGSISLDCLSKDRVYFKLDSLTEDILVNNPTNIVSGQLINLFIRQDAVGGRSLSWGSKFVGTIPAPTGTGLKGTLYEFIVIDNLTITLNSDPKFNIS